MPANDEFKPIPVTEESDFLVWGIVTYVIHKAR
jgi:DNA polymerase V